MMRENGREREDEGLTQFKKLRFPLRMRTI